MFQKSCSLKQIEFTSTDRVHPSTDRKFKVQSHQVQSYKANASEPANFNNHMLETPCIRFLTLESCVVSLL